MKKLKAIAAAFAVLAVIGMSGAVFGCKHMDSDEHSSAHVHQYSCGMHPEIVQNTPGNCPKCGMQLLEKQ